jgi:hypothetical protein
VLENADCIADLNPDSLFSVLARLPKLSSSSSLTIIFIATSFPPRLTSGLWPPHPNNPLPPLHKIPIHQNPQTMLELGGAEDVVGDGREREKSI